MKHLSKIIGLLLIAISLSFTNSDSNHRRGARWKGYWAVSYTHLTLPTNREV